MYPGSSIKVGDIVVCNVQPGNYYYCHLVWDRYELVQENTVKRTCWIIGNNKPGDAKKMNGWCYREHIYDILTKVADNFVVAVEAVKGALEGVREQQAANEIANGDLAILQLGLKVDVPIRFEGVEEDLPITRFHDGVEVVPIVCNLQGISP